MFSFQCDKHQPALVKLICDELGITADQMMDFELCVADTQPAVSSFVSDKTKSNSIFVFKKNPENCFGFFSQFLVLHLFSYKHI